MKHQITTTFLIIFSLLSYSQNISIEFPAFAGKTYDFIIFQGGKQEIIQQDTIPSTGKININIPKKYAPYTGMCRWLITNSQEGGGLDMAIPGYDFSVSCLSDKPDNSNIIFNGFDAVNELNRLHTEQQKIIDKFELMNKALELYDKNHPLYASFTKEKEDQIVAFENFQTSLKKNTNFNARILPIINLINGIPHVLTHNNREKAIHIKDYITNLLDVKDLYVSGHWDIVIKNWVMIHINVIEDKKTFVEDFQTITNRINSPELYTDFTGKTTYYLTQYGKDDYIDAIAHTVLESKKVTAYLGSMQVYLKAIPGMQAPDLILPNTVKKSGIQTNSTNILKSSKFAVGKFKKTLLLFYQSSCGPCEELLKKLPEQYAALKAKNIDIIAVSADENEQEFLNTSKKFPWLRTYCDYDGRNGINFKNYAVVGTPILYLIDKYGKIERRIYDVSEILK